MSWIGLDIGGANIKIALTDNTIRSIPIPLWKDKDQLLTTLKSIVSSCPERTKLAVTMTGELADCFDSKKEGVAFIVSRVCDVTDDAHFFQTHGSFVTAEVATEHWILTAAANWCAIALFAARFMPERTGTLIDIGSTTTDIIPVINGHLASHSRTDFQRLRSSELVYTGVSRSSINGLLSHLEIDGVEVAIANENFATALDANLYLENINQSKDTTFTADGRESTIRDAVKRLARVLCADPEELKPNVIRQIAESVIEEQQARISKALRGVLNANPESAKCFVTSGSGDWLARRILRNGHANIPVIEFGKVVSQAASECAAAVAVRELAKSTIALD